MSRIRGTNTKPELQIRKLLFAEGFRYKLNDASLPGKPDLVFPKYKAVIFVHGCFWHGHGCRLFKVPETNREFWVTKIANNRANDSRCRKALQRCGWRILTIWECALRGPGRLDPAKIASAASDWLLSARRSATIGGVRTQRRRGTRAARS